MSDTMLLGVLRMPVDDHGDIGLMQFIGRAREAADRIEADAVRIEALESAIKFQASAAKRGMDAASSVGYHMEKEARRLHAECSPEALESERDANAKLTEELERALGREQALAAHARRMKTIADEAYASYAACHEHECAAALTRLINAEAPTTSLASHPDDAAVDHFARGMKLKLAAAREKGRDGWDDPDRCSVKLLADLLMEHLQKANSGNCVDIANLAMMLHLRMASPELLARKFARLKAQWQAEALAKVRANHRSVVDIPRGALIEAEKDCHSQAEEGVNHDD